MPSARSAAAAEGLSARSPALDALFDLEETVRRADMFGQLAGHMVEGIIRPNAPDRGTILTNREAELLTFAVYQATEALASVLEAWEAAHARGVEAGR